MQNIPILSEIRIKPLNLYIFEELEKIRTLCYKSRNSGPSTKSRLVHARFSALLKNTLLLYCRDSGDIYLMYTKLSYLHESSRPVVSKAILIMIQIYYLHLFNKRNDIMYKNRSWRWSIDQSIISVMTSCIKIDDRHNVLTGWLIEYGYLFTEP